MTTIIDEPSFLKKYSKPKPKMLIGPRYKPIGGPADLPPGWKIRPWGGGAKLTRAEAMRGLGSQTSPFT